MCLYCKLLVYLYMNLSNYRTMFKNSIVLAGLLLVFTGYAQQSKKLVLNEEINLIEATYYHDNGVISQRGTFNLDRKLHGQWISYDEEGQKVALGTYINGIKTGKWLFWEGDKLTEVEYKNNLIASIDSIEKNSGVVKNN